MEEKICTAVEGVQMEWKSEGANRGGRRNESGDLAETEAVGTVGEQTVAGPLRIK